jgi:hypothetical protein
MVLFGLVAVGFGPSGEGLVEHRRLSAVTGDGGGGASAGMGPGQQSSAAVGVKVERLSGERAPHQLQGPGIALFVIIILLGHRYGESEGREGYWSQAQESKAAVLIRMGGRRATNASCGQGRNASHCEPERQFRLKLLSRLVETILQGRIGT